MEMRFDDTCKGAIERLKAALPDGGEIDAFGLLSSLLHVSEPLRAQYSRVAEHIDRLEPTTADPGRRPVSAQLRPLLVQAADATGLVQATALVRVLLVNEGVGRALTARGLPEDELKRLWGELVADERPTEHRPDPERDALARELARFGRLLTPSDLTPVELYGRDALFPSLLRPLARLLRNDVLLIGPSGVGKTTLVRELARRVAGSDPTLPPLLRAAEVFELSAELLTPGATSSADLARRVGALMKLLARHRHVILLIDPIDPLLAGDPYRDPAVRRAEEVLLSLVEGPTPVLACASPDGVHRLQQRPGWRGAFDHVHLHEPSDAATLALLTELVPRFREHYGPVELAPTVLDAIVHRAVQAYPASAQPRRAIQLLDDVLAANLTATDGDTRLTLDDVDAALAYRHGVDRESELTDAAVLAELRQHIVGQDGALERIARIFATSLSAWNDPERPRAVFLFGGPTGVGKTETAIRLAHIVGGSSASLIRVDCNTLQRAGRDTASVSWPLLGVPLGFVGHGEGGQLSAIARHPRSVVLFDELEKADPAVGKLLLQILDTGRVRDNDGVELDFTQAVIIFTTNLGVTYDVERRLGFGERSAAGGAPRVDLEAIRRELVGMGYGHEFIGRIRDTFLFRGLDEGTAATIIERQLARLAARVLGRGLQLEWGDQLPTDLAKRFDPRFGVRQLLNDVERRAAQQIGLAELNGTLRGVERIKLEAGEASHESERREGQVLVLRI